jgi:hypothetical protein
MSIHAQLVAVTRRIAKEGIGKTRNNAQQGYKFRGVDEVMNAFAPILADEGLFLRPRFTERDVAERTTQKGTALFYVTVKGEFDFANESGETVTVGPFYGEAMDSADKATNKAMAVAFKYAMFQTFCVPLEGVTGGDADGTTHDDVQPTPAQKIKPTDGVWEAMDADQQIGLQKIAADVMDILTDANEPDKNAREAAAYHHIKRQKLDTDETTALWTLLDSKARSAIKRAAANHAAQQQKEAA